MSFSSLFYLKICMCAWTANHSTTQKPLGQSQDNDRVDITVARQELAQCLWQVNFPDTLRSLCLWGGQQRERERNNDYSNNLCVTHVLSLRPPPPFSSVKTTTEMFWLSTCFSEYGNEINTGLGVGDILYDQNPKTVE